MKLDRNLSTRLAPAQMKLNQMMALWTGEAMQGLLHSMDYIDFTTS
jgi:hypothetical protein